MSRKVRVAALSDVEEGGVHGVMVGYLGIVLARSDGEIYALEDCCSHDEFPLSAGAIEDGEIVCMLHGASFDLATGEARTLPAVSGVRKFEVSVEGDDIFVHLD